MLTEKQNREIMNFGLAGSPHGFDPSDPVCQQWRVKVDVLLQSGLGVGRPDNENFLRLAQRISHLFQEARCHRDVTGTRRSGLVVNMAPPLVGRMYGDRFNDAIPGDAVQACNLVIDPNDEMIGIRCHADTRTGVTATILKGRCTPFSVMVR